MGGEGGRGRDPRARVWRTGAKTERGREEERKRGREEERERGREGERERYVNGKRDPVHHRLLETISETATVLELKQQLLYTTPSGWWWRIESVFRIKRERGRGREGERG